MSNNNRKNNGLYFIVGAALVAVLALGYMMATGHFSDDPDLSIEVSEDGIDLDTN